MFANLIKEMRLRKISQDDLSKLLNKTPTTISRYMLGKSEFTCGQMQAIRNTFFKNLSIDYLFKIETAKENKED